MESSTKMSKPRLFVMGMALGASLLMGYVFQRDYRNMIIHHTFTLVKECPGQVIPMMSEVDHETFRREPRP